MLVASSPVVIESRCIVLLVLLALIAATALSRPAAASSSFRLVDLKVTGEKVELKLAIHNEHAPGTVVDIYAHERAPRHATAVAQGRRILLIGKGTTNVPPDTPLVRDGLQIASLQGLQQGDSMHTIRTTLKELQSRNIGIGSTLYLAGNWATNENSGAGHQWGALFGFDMKDSSRVLAATQNSGLGRSRSIPRGPYGSLLRGKSSLRLSGLPIGLALSPRALQPPADRPRWWRAPAMTAAQKRATTSRAR